MYYNNNNNNTRIIIFLKIIYFFILLYFNKINIFNKNIIIEIDNKINDILYENDLDFSKYSTNIKIIAVYYPEYLITDNIYHNNNTINEWKIINNAKPLFNEHKQPRKPDYKYTYFENKSNLSKLIKRQVKLAKNHGIYGFGINYFWFSGEIYCDELINVFINDKEMKYPFFLIWKNDNLFLNVNNDIKIDLLDQEYNIHQTYMFFKDIKKYLLSDNYIKYRGKPMLAIYNPLIITNLRDYLSNLRKIAITNEIGELYILGTLLNNFNNSYKDLFDAFYEFPPLNLNLNRYHKNEYFYYYTGLIYREIDKYEKNLTLYKGIMLQYDNSPEIKNKPIIFNDFSPEKYYIIIKVIIKQTLNHHNINDNIIFINGWNNWKEGSYLEPDEYFGYASLNALSKALFNISFYDNNYNIKNLKNITKVAVQAHIYYEDLIKEIINLVNNIPIKYDLFISTTTLEIKNKIIHYIDKFSNTNKYEIIILENKGRDVLPLLTQLRNKNKQYKYLCHIHSKKSKTSPLIGIQWRNYLFNNLLGNIRIVSEILSDFENNDKLGFIFPETFYEIIGLSFRLTKKTKKYMNYIIKKLFFNYKIGSKLEFPAGNMFWARFMAIYQIFEFNFNNKFDKENDQTNDTIMHGIERIWLYLVKLNGFYYKKIFKCFK